MTGDRHVRFCERRGVQLPPATHPDVDAAVVQTLAFPRWGVCSEA